MTVTTEELVDAVLTWAKTNGDDYTNAVAELRGLATIIEVERNSPHGIAVGRYILEEFKTRQAALDAMEKMPRGFTLVMLPTQEKTV